MAPVRGYYVILRIVAVPLTSQVAASPGGNMHRTIGFILVAGLIGCDSATAPDTSYVGSYTLASINGGPTYSQETDRVKYFTGVVWVDADRTYSAYAISQDCFVNGCAVVEIIFASNGNWTRKNNQFALVNSESGQTTVWTYADNKLTLTDAKNFPAPGILVFEKDDVTKPRQ